MIRTQSQLFNFALPNHSILEIKGNITNQAISDVTRIFLQPLSLLEPTALNLEEITT